MSRVRKIEITFPFPVEFPEGFERALDGLIDMVCKKYERENPRRVMWPAGCGSKPIWTNPHEPDFDDSIFCIDVAEREAHEKELQRRADRGN